MGTTWLRSDWPVIPSHASMWKYLPELEHALHRGVIAVRDPDRPAFYEIEIGPHWFYVHIPSRITGVYLVAVARTTFENASVLMEHAC